MEILVFLTKETSKDIIFTSERLLKVESMDFQQNNTSFENFSFPINALAK